MTEDEEIKKHIEERKRTAKNEKQRLKEHSKKIKKIIRDRKEIKKARKITTKTSRVRRDQEHFLHQICEEKSTQSERKERQTRDDHISM